MVIPMNKLPIMEVALTVGPFLASLISYVGMNGYVDMKGILMSIYTAGFYIFILCIVAVILKHTEIKEAVILKHAQIREAIRNARLSK